MMKQDLQPPSLRVNLSEVARITPLKGGVASAIIGAMLPKEEIHKGENDSMGAATAESLPKTDDSIEEIAASKEEITERELEGELIIPKEYTSGRRKYKPLRRLEMKQICDLVIGEKLSVSDAVQRVGVGIGDYYRKRDDFPDLISSIARELSLRKRQHGELLAQRRAEKHATESAPIESPVVSEQSQQSQSTVASFVPTAVVRDNQQRPVTAPTHLYDKKTVNITHIVGNIEISIRSGGKLTPDDVAIIKVVLEALHEATYMKLENDANEQPADDK